MAESGETVIGKMKIRISFPEERNAKVAEDLHLGSEPGPRFFLFVAISTLIAGLGLVMDSTAVVIGAMLVAPLMTPILGLGLALVNGDAPLLGKALRAEIIGVSLAIFASFMLGMAIPYFQPTPEMLSRTEPNLFDLLVAVLAGVAGAYAIVDEKVSPTLPGVAISTAIVPPLANSGLCLALGAYDGAIGSFLLFFTNFLSILLVSALVFHVTGMSRQLTSEPGSAFFRRFGIAIAGFLVVAGFLGVELIQMMDRRSLRNNIGTALRAEIADYRVSNVNDLFIERREGQVFVLAEVEAPRIISPAKVGSLQRRLKERTGEPVELFVRTSITHDVSAEGSIELGNLEKLDGYYPLDRISPEAEIVQQSEQALREFLEGAEGIYLQDIEIFEVEGNYAVLAEVTGFRSLAPQEISAAEDLIRRRLPDKSVNLVVQQETSVLIDRYGRFRSDFSRFQRNDPAQDEIVARAIAISEKWLAETDFDLDSISTFLSEGMAHLLLEVSGPRLFTDEDLADLKIAMASSGSPSRVFVRSRLETLIGDEEFDSFEALLRTFRNRTAPSGEQ
jgi:uncharacterized hydrophobic protein (TIGR00271 family)